MFTNLNDYFDAVTSNNYKKPVVHYSKLIGIVEIGHSAMVVTVDHPAEYLNRAIYVQTSAVQKWDEGSGEIETLNTLYKPVKA